MSDVVEAMRTTAPQYQRATVRTHVTSKMCRNAPDNHAVMYHDFERVGRGLYRLL